MNPTPWKLSEGNNNITEKPKRAGKIATCIATATLACSVDAADLLNDVKTNQAPSDIKASELVQENKEKLMDYSVYPSQYAETFTKWEPEFLKYLDVKLTKYKWTPMFDRIRWKLIESWKINVDRITTDAMNDDTTWISSAWEFFIKTTPKWFQLGEI